MNSQEALEIAMSYSVALKVWGYFPPLWCPWVLMDDRFIPARQRLMLPAR